jgi:lipoprotein Spr
MFKHLRAAQLLSFLIFIIAIVSASCSASRKTAGSNARSPGTASSERELRKKYASRLSVSSGDIRNVLLYRFIDEWYGTPYRYGGNGKNGIDCSGFSTKLYAGVYDMPIQRTAQQQFNASKRVKRKKLREGDLVFFNEGGKRITHVGVYLTNAYFVHAGTGNGVIISNLNEAYWQRHFAGGGRLR